MPGSSFLERANIGRRFTTLLVAIAASAASLVATGTPADANPVQPKSCSPERYYSETMVDRNAFLPMGMVFTSGQSGGNLTMQSSTQWNLSVGAKVSGNISADVDVIVAGAKAQLGVEVSASASIQQTYTTTYGPIAAGKYGHMQWVAWAYGIRWTLNRVNGNCTITELGSGTAVLPNPANQGYRTWTTDTANFRSA